MTAHHAGDGPEPALHPRVRSSWPWIAGGIALVVYLAAGWWMRYQLHYAIGDALSRSADARAVVESRDPHLTAVGFVWLPLPVLVQLPFSLVLSKLNWADFAGPMSTAACTAAMVVLFAKITETLKLRLGIALILTTLLAFNPVVVYYAANGMSEASSFMFYCLAALGLVRWSRTPSTAHLATIGAGLAGAMLCRYETLLLIPVFAIAAALQVRPGRHATRWGMVAVTVALPAIFAFILWLAVSAVIMHDPFYWQKALRFEGTPPPGAVWLPTRTLANGVLYSLRLTLRLAPGFIPIGILLVARRSVVNAVVGATFVAAGAAFPLYVAYGVGTNQSWGDPRYFAPLTIFSAIGAAWIVATHPARQQAAWLACVAALLVVSTVASVTSLSDTRIAPIEGEPVVFSHLTGASVPTTSYKGQPLEVWRRVVREIDPLLTGRKTIAVDTNVEFAAALLTRRPTHFVIDSDRDFQSLMADPAGKIDYLLYAQGGPTSDAVLFQNALATTAGGQWSMLGPKFALGNGSSVQLYRWVPAGGASPAPQPTVRSG